jgi:hypothetical protein
MGKKRLIILITSVLVLAVGIDLLALRSHDPIYQGKSLSAWLQGYQYADRAPQHKEADEAVQHIGTNAIPTLLRMLRSKDSAFTVKLRKLARKVAPNVEYHMAAFDNNHATEGFKALGSVASNAVPQLIEIYELNISEDSQSETAMSLAYVGPAAIAAVPSLLNGIKTNSSSDVRFSSIKTLGAIHSLPEKVVPVLTDLLNNSGVIVRLAAAEALGHYGTNAKPAVTTLFKALNDRELAVRDAAEEALTQIDPTAFVVRLTEALGDADAEVRAKAAATLQSAGFGMEARSAVPALIRATRDPDESVRSFASEALKTIDPEAAAKAGIK